jgi:hypothetical protein
MATLDDPFGSNTGHTKRTPNEKIKFTEMRVLSRKVLVFS